jgi:NAD(P)-dependent dehydrogenase (short-subunit alcohol dehydrogenase family)
MLAISILTAQRSHPLDAEIDEQPRPHRQLPAEGVNDMHGKGIAKGLAVAGAAVVVNYAWSREGAERVVADITVHGGKAIAVQGDVWKAADVKRLFDKTKAWFGALDVLGGQSGDGDAREWKTGGRSAIMPHGNR